MMHENMLEEQEHQLQELFLEEHLLQQLTQKFMMALRGQKQQT